MKKFSFDPKRGCLYHPCGFLTSWFRRDEKGEWVATEWACDLSPAVETYIMRSLSSGKLQNEEWEFTAP